MIEVHAAIQHDLLAGSKSSALVDVTAMKPLGVNKTCSIGEDSVEYASA